MNNINWKVDSENPMVIVGHGTETEYKIVWNEGNRFFDENTFSTEPVFIGYYNTVLKNSNLQPSWDKKGYSTDLNEIKKQLESFEERVLLKKKLKANRGNCPVSFVPSFDVTITLPPVTFNSKEELEKWFLDEEQKTKDSAYEFKYGSEKQFSCYKYHHIPFFTDEIKEEVEKAVGSEVELRNGDGYEIYLYQPKSSAYGKNFCDDLTWLLDAKKDDDWAKKNAESIFKDFESDEERALNE